MPVSGRRVPYILGPKGEADRYRRMLLRNHANHEHDGRNARHDCPACQRFSPIFNRAEGAPYQSILKAQGRA